MSDICHRLHILFNSLSIHWFPYQEAKIPLNGIYILFEDGEIAHGVSRIVRVGTHTGKNQLRSRLHQHFLDENKDRSIFRKNIGRAFLNKTGDPYLTTWNLDNTKREDKAKHAHLVNKSKQAELEKQITEYIQTHFCFVVIEVPEENQRDELETKIISTVSLCRECAPSTDWFGRFSPKEKIRSSGMWLVNKLYKQPFSEKQILEFEKIVSTSL